MIVSMQTMKGGFGLLSLLITLSVLSLLVAVSLHFVQDTAPGSSESTDLREPIDEAEMAREMMNQHSTDINVELEQ